MKLKPLRKHELRILENAEARTRVAPKHAGTLINDFGAASRVTAYRYDDPTGISGVLRGCVISIDVPDLAEKVVRYRFKGQSRAASDLCEGNHVRLYSGSDPQLEYERWDPLESTCRHASLSIL